MTVSKPETVEVTQALPDALPGHWDTADGREMAERYLAMDRSQLGKSDLSDMALANAQYLEDISVGTITIQSAIAMQTAAKERIRWLSAQLAEARHRLNATPEVPADVGYRMHVQHETVKAGQAAREILAAAMEPHFPVEAEMARKNLHFMLPASWAVEAIQSAIDRATPSRQDGLREALDDGFIAELRDAAERLVGVFDFSRESRVVQLLHKAADRLAALSDTPPPDKAAGQ